MSRITKTFSPKAQKNKYGTPAPTTVNVEGFPAYEKSGETQYLQMLMTNVLGNTFYENAEVQKDQSLALHRKAIQEFPDFVAPAAVYARNKGYMRTQPILALAHLAKAGRSEFETAFPSIIQTPNDLFDFVTFYGTLAQGQGGRRVKRIVSKWLRERLNAYWLIKYGSDRDNGGYSLRDVFITMHPKGVDRGYGDYVMRGIVPVFDPAEGRSAPDYFKLAAFEKLKNAKTLADAVSAVVEGRLPHEVVTPFAAKFPGIWDSIVPQYPVFALLKSLNTIKSHVHIDDHRETIVGKLTNPTVIGKAKILPISVLQAFGAINAQPFPAPAWLGDALRVMLDLSFMNVLPLPGVVTIGLDVSGSMMGDKIKTASIMAVALASKSQDNRLYLFDDTLKIKPISHMDSLLTQAESICVGGSTSTDLVARQVIEDARNGRVADTIVLLTDEQQNTGDPFYQSICRYRVKHNPDARLFVIDVGSYSNSGSLAPEGGKNYYICGLSPRALDFIALAAEGFDTMAEMVKRDGLIPF